MKICVISGSHRNQSNSNRIADYIAAQMLEIEPGWDVTTLKLSDIQLPMWDESVYSAKSPLALYWNPVSEKLKSADAFVVISPEWGGMATPGIKNLFLFCSNEELSHKPALIVTVSSGSGGSYPVSELRMSAYKNNHICFIPEQVVVRFADHVFAEPQNPVSDHDQGLRDRMQYSLRILCVYATALRSVRRSGLVDHNTFPYGM